MSKNDDHIIELKPGLYGVNINLRSLWRRLTAKQTPDPAIAVAQRFLYLFRQHGVTDAQIPRLITDITLEKLRSPETLLPALTNKVIEQAINLFNVNRTWLEGREKRIYDRHWCYKEPKKFLEDLAALKLKSVHFPIVAFCSDKKLDYSKNRRQRVTLCLVEKIVDLDEEQICRYVIYGDSWDWDHPKCRIQLKAMVRSAREVFNVPVVPLYLVKIKDLEAIESGYRIPLPFLRSRLHDVSLEDFTLSSEQSMVSKETDELPAVFDYIRAHGLDASIPTTNRQ